MTATTPTVTFGLPINASAETVEELIATIRRTFNAARTISTALGGPDAIDAATHDLTGDVSPQQAQAAQNASAAPLVEGTDEAGPRDAFGWPWNSQIHASTKTTIGNGAWRGKSRLDDATRTKVQAEMVAAYGLTLPGADAPAAAEPAAPAAPTKPAGPPKRPAPPQSSTPTAKPEFTAYTKFLAEAQAENPDLSDEWLAGVYQYYKATDAQGGGSLAAVAALEPDAIVEIHNYVAETHADMMAGE